MSIFNNLSAWYFADMVVQKNSATQRWVGKFIYIIVVEDNDYDPDNNNYDNDHTITSLKYCIFLLSHPIIERIWQEFHHYLLTVQNLLSGYNMDFYNCLDLQHVFDYNFVLTYKFNQIHVPRVAGEVAFLSLQPFHRTVRCCMFSIQ